MVKSYAYIAPVKQQQKHPKTHNPLKMSKLAQHQVTVTGPKDIVATMSEAAATERDPSKLAAIRAGLFAALHTCTVTVRNDANPGDKWA